ncbi:MAG: hypothetical protein ACXVBW_04800, partial [Bdellovibrionota bacterium]
AVGEHLLFGRALVIAVRMRVRVAFALAMMMLVSQAAQGSIPETSKIVRLEKFGQLRVGESIEKFPSLSRARYGLVSARFYFYLFHPSLPQTCLNLECGLIARPILQRGGMLIGGANESFVKELGESSDDPVLLVTDSNGKVTAIYRHLHKHDLHQILRALAG